MFKVICIEQPPSVAYKTGGIKINVPDNCTIYVGEEYNVIRVRKGYMNTTMYILSERPRDWGYNSKYFALVTDLDETMLVNNKQDGYA